MSGVPLDMCAVKINKSTWSYEHRVSKHFVIFHNFPCLLASLLRCLLIMSLFLAYFVVRDLCRSGCRSRHVISLLNCSFAKIFRAPINIVSSLFSLADGALEKQFSTQQNWF